MNLDINMPVTELIGYSVILFTIISGLYFVFKYGIRYIYNRLSSKYFVQGDIIVLKNKETHILYGWNKNGFWSINYNSTVSPDWDKVHSWFYLVRNRSYEGRVHVIGMQKFMNKIGIKNLKTVYEILGTKQPNRIDKSPSPEREDLVQGKNKDVEKQDALLLDMSEIQLQIYLKEAIANEDFELAEKIKKALERYN